MLQASILGIKLYYKHKMTTYKLFSRFYNNVLYIATILLMGLLNYLNCHRITQYGSILYVQVHAVDCLFLARNETFLS